MSRSRRILALILVFTLPAAIASAGEASSTQPLLRPWPAPLYYLPTSTNPLPAENPGRPILEPAALGAHLSTERGAAPLAVAPPPPLGFVAIAPCRQYDSRSATPLLQGTTRNVTLTGAPCGIPVGSAAISVNIAVFSITGATGNGVFSVGIPAGASQAFLNYPPGQSQIDNAGVVPANGAGAVAVSVNQGAGSVDFVVDVNGYYTTTGTVTAAETLRIVRGMIFFDGTIVAGTGFTVVKNATGKFTITFSTAFSGFPAVTLTILQNTGGTVVINTESAAGFDYWVYNPAGALADVAYIMMNAVGSP